MLEILRAGSPSNRPPLVFVHGSFCGAWIWSEHFLPFFAERGWRCVAVSLRGHGGSAGRDQLDSFGITDYVADVGQAAAEMESQPVIIGHSLGGMVAQRFVKRHGASGLVMLASVGPGGLGGSLAHMTTLHPDLLWELGRLQTLGPEAANYEIIRRGLFSAGFPAELAWRYARLFQRESQRASQELLLPQWFNLMARPSLPALVLGGAGDAFIPYTDLVASSALWSAQLKVLDDLPHVMMLDSAWRKAAEALNAWLEATFAKR
jgi:pimeloyl-ACP methyl ester carboxylesterase